MRHRTEKRRCALQVDCLEARNAPTAGLHHAFGIHAAYIHRGPNVHRQHPSPPWAERSRSVWDQHGSGFNGVDGGGGNGNSGFHSLVVK